MEPDAVDRILAYRLGIRQVSTPQVIICQSQPHTHTHTAAPGVDSSAAENSPQLISYNEQFHLKHETIFVRSSVGTNELAADRKSDMRIIL